MEAVLKKFDDALKCGICRDTNKRPFTTGSCSHFFCQDCLLGLIQSICPKCKEPFYPGNITPDTTVGSIFQEINKISKIIKSSRAPSNSFQGEVLHDEHKENKSLESIKIAEKENKKGSIYTKNLKSWTLVQNENECPKLKESAKKVSTDINENSPVFQSNETQSVDMIGNSQSPIKKTALCFSKQKMRHVLNDVKSANEVHVLSKNNFVGKTDKICLNKSSDSDVDFDGFPKEVVYVKNSLPFEDDSSNIKNGMSVRMKRKSSLNGLDDGNIDEKVENTYNTKERRKIKQHNWWSKVNQNNEDKPDDCCLSINNTSQNGLKRIEKKSFLNEAADGKQILKNLNKTKKIDKKDTDSLSKETSPNDPSDRMKKMKNNASSNATVNVKNVDGKSLIRAEEKDTDVSNEDYPNNSSTIVKKKRNPGLGNLNSSISKKSRSFILVRKNYNEPKNLTPFENDSSEIIPATPRDAAVGLVLGPVSTRGKRQMTSLNVNSTKRRDSVKRNRKGETPLLAACAKGNLAEVENLIREGSDPNIKDYAGWTPLHEAVLKGNIEIVEALVKAGANINTPGHLNITPLLEAVLQDSYSIVSFLLKNGADRSLRSRYNYRPLDCAQGEEMIKLLNQVHQPVGMATKEASTNFCMPDPFCLCPIRLNAEQSQTLRDFCIKFDLKCVQSLRPEVSHAIVVTQDTNVCKCDVNILKCLANGTAVISFNWIEYSLKSNVMTKPDVWEVHGTEEFPSSEAFIKSRINAQKLLPKLFDGLHVSLNHNWTVWKDMKKNDIMDIVQEAGAIVLNREPDPEAIPTEERTVMFHAMSDGPMGICSHVSLYVPGVKEPLLKYNMKHLKTLSVKWIVDCIQSFKIIDPL